MAVQGLEGEAGGWRWGVRLGGPGVRGWELRFGGPRCVNPESGFFGPIPPTPGAGKGRTGRRLRGAVPPQAGGLGPSREAGPLTRVGGSRPGEWVSSQPLTSLPAALVAKVLARRGPAAPTPHRLAPPAPSLCLCEQRTLGLKMPAAIRGQC